MLKQTLREHTVRALQILADPTRLRIFETISESGEPHTVHSIAASASISLNVARMHLTKLFDAGLIESEVAHEKRRGAPEHIYHRKNESVDFSLPIRNFRLLAELLLRSIKLQPATARKCVENIGKDFGRELVNRHLPDLIFHESTLQEIGRFAKTQMDSLGFDMEISVHDTILVLKDNRCIFEEVAFEDPELICHLHRAILYGILDELIGAYQPESKVTIATGGHFCLLEIHPAATLSPPIAASSPDESVEVPQEREGIILH